MGKPNRFFWTGGLGAGQAVRAISSCCSDVCRDNGAVPIMPSAWSICSIERAKVGEGVEPCGVSAVKPDLQRVLADQGYVLDSQFLIGQAAHARQTAWYACFASTLGARARPSQLIASVPADVSPFPHDLHHLLLAIDVDRDGKRFRVFQWTLMTGSWRND
jgi:hypothetical protein